jgi:hypothetical protein
MPDHSYGELQSKGDSMFITLGSLIFPGKSQNWWLTSELVNINGTGCRKS